MVDLEVKSKPKVAWVFPGQGSQSVGMGYNLYQNSRKAREVFDEADSALQIPLSRLCFEGPGEELRDTINAQPAILTTCVACLRAASEFGLSLRPSFVAGHSLGEYTALVAADVIDFADAVRLVRERGRLMQQAGKSTPGGMAAIMGLDEASLEEVCLETGAQIANFNSPSQIVISGSREALARSMDLAKARGARRVVPLQVSGAFHSTLMQPAVEGLAKAIEQISFHTPSVPVIANSTAQPLTTPDEVKDELLDQLCRCVRWQPSVKYMVDVGVSTFVEIGPDQVLSGMIKRIDNEVQVLNMSDPESIKAVNL
ncbi:MAG: ACP S-malonyltransferase [Chloroflexota bacterium]|nr:ACP S-malonyltransferase [Chloroflexota bacterium]